MRLINADSLAEIFADRMELIVERYGVDSSEAGILSGAYKLLESMPTITPEPVVRCKDCKYWSERFPECNRSKRSRYGFGVNDYCSKGKRKGAEDENKKAD